MHIKISNVKLSNLFNDCYSIESEAKYKTIHEKGPSSMLACIAKVSDHSNPSDIARVAKVSRSYLS